MPYILTYEPLVCLLNRCGCSNIDPLPVLPPEPSPPCYICDGDPDATIWNPSTVIPFEAIPPKLLEQIPEIFDGILDIIPPEITDQILKLTAGFTGFEITCGLLDSFASGAMIFGHGLSDAQCLIVNEMGDEIMKLYVCSQ